MTAGREVVAPNLKPPGAERELTFGSVRKYIKVSSFRYTDPYLKVIPINSTLYKPIYSIEKNTTSTILDNRNVLEFSKENPNLKRSENC